MENNCASITANIEKVWGGRVELQLMCFYGSEECTRDVPL